MDHRNQPNEPQFFDISRLTSYKYGNSSGIDINLMIEESPQKWAEASGYRYTSQADENEIKTPIQNCFLFNKAIEYAVSRPKEAVTNVFADNLTCVYWNWGVRPNLPFGEIVFLEISKEDIYIGSAFWAKYYPFLSNHQDGKCTLKFDGNINYHSVEEQVYFLGGVNQEGHFVKDLIPKLMGIKMLNLDRNIPIVVSRLYPYQRKIIKDLGLNFSFYEIAPPESMSFDLVRFRNAFVSYPLTSSIKSTFFRQCVAHIRGGFNADRNFVQNLPKYFYLKRDSSEETKRVFNTSDIEKALGRLGFLSISCEGRDPKELIALFSNAKLIVSDPYTPLLNWHNYCRSSCYAIWMIPESYSNGIDPTPLNNGVLDDLFVSLDKLFILTGTLTNDVYSSTAPHTYCVEDLLLLVEKIQCTYA